VRRLGLLRGILFAVFAGLGVLFWSLVIGPIVGRGPAAAIYALALVPLYAITVAPNLRLGAIAFSLAAALALPVLCFDPVPRLALAITPFVLGIIRSTVLFPRPLARALFLELGVSALALLVAAVFHDPSPIGTTFAVWAFWLVQAGFALAPGEPAPGRQAVGDRFELAHARALAILERGPAPPRAKP
jgi:hypothetical protein